MVVGSKVVCIDDSFDPAVLEFYTALPKKGTVYVVREMRIGVNPQNDPGEICIYVIGLNNPRSTVSPFPERGFRQERFRDLDEVQGRNHRSDPAIDVIGIDQPNGGNSKIDG